MTLPGDKINIVNSETQVTTKKLYQNEKKNHPETRACFRCGRDGHLVKNCYATTDVRGVSLPEEGCEELHKKIQCSRCKRTGHYTDECYARTTKDHRLIQNETRNFIPISPEEE